MIDSPSISLLASPINYSTNSTFFHLLFSASSSLALLSFFSVAKSALRGRVLATRSLIDTKFAKMADIYNMKRGNGAQAMVSEAASRSSGEIDANGEKPYINRDDREMAYMGKKQQLKRNFGFMSMLGFSCTLMITWEGLFSVFVFGLEDGGPAGLVYGYIFCWIGYAAVVASLAEMVSM